MKRLITRGFWSGILLAVIVLGCRLLWVASPTETGFSLLKQSLREATIGWIVGKRVPIHTQEPPRQADFWLAEVDRVGRAHPHDARTLMGAALVLDMPANNYVVRHMKVDRAAGFGPILKMDNEAIKRAEKVFVSRCAKPCLELAARATQLEPDNPQWWQLRAVLLWQCSANSTVDAPRRPDWAKTLDQCARHDPDNALYDYLAAHFLWQESAKVDFSTNTERLIITDAERFQAGVRHFERGQTKPFFVVGQCGIPAVAEFLRWTRVPVTDHALIANSRYITYRCSGLLIDLSRWQQHRADQAARSGDIKTALARKRQNLHLIDQYVRASDRNAADSVAVASRMGTATTMNQLARKHKDLLSPDELREIDALDREARLEQQVVRQAAKQFATGQQRRAMGLAPTMNGTPGRMLVAFAVGTLPLVMGMLVSIGLITGILWWVLGRHGRPTVGPFGQVLAFVTAVAVTSVGFGMAPAALISRDVQAWTATITLFALVVVAIGWVCLWSRRHTIKFSLRTMLIAMGILGAVCAALSVARPDLRRFQSMPFDLSMPARGYDHIDAVVFESAIRRQSDWLWAAFQWFAYSGYYLAPALWITMLGVIFVVKVRRQQRHTDNESESLRFRDQASALCRTISSGCITLAALLLVAFLVLMPPTLLAAEKSFQTSMAYVRNPDVYWARVDKTIQDVRSDKKQMDELRTWVRSQMIQQRKSTADTPAPDQK